jgi:myo-inositol-1(or 4)-monophosphatase
MTSKKIISEQVNVYTSKDLTDALIRSIVDEIKTIFTELGPKIVKNAGKASFLIKEDGTPVTEFDGLIEEKILKKLNEVFPRLTVYGEETGYIEDLPEVCLLIDPIDGTESFIKGIPSFTSMAVLIVNNEPIACVIYNPTSINTYAAIKNKGAFVNNKRLDLTTTQLPDTVISKVKHMKILNEILNPIKVMCVTAPSGAGDAFSRVAEGLTAAKFQIIAGGYIHDYAPGALLVREAGGEIISLDKTEYTVKSRNFIACHPALKSHLLNNIEVLKNYSKTFIY